MYKRQGLDLPDDVCDFIAENVTSNVRQIEGTVKKIHAYHNLNGMTLDIPNVKRAITDIINTTSILPTPALIISEVSRFYGIEAVSYTHLDVYKRQRQSHAGRRY